MEEFAIKELEKIIVVLFHLFANLYIWKKLSGKLEDLYTYRVWPY